VIKKWQIMTKVNVIWLGLLLLCSSNVFAQESSSYQGLWVGTVTVNAVSHISANDDTTPIPTRSPFQFPLLIHINADDQPRLLKQVAVIWQEQEDGAGGRYRLFTDLDSLNRYPELQDNNVEGRRISSAVFDFPGHQLDMTGNIATEKSLAATIKLSPELPTHPFRHQFHPDHDDPEEIYTIDREIKLLFTTPNNEETTRLSGNYHEILSGLHKRPLYVTGEFILEKVVTTAYLNQ